MRYLGEVQPEKTRHDGRLPHAVGVHQFQAFRANRTHPAEGGVAGWTYNHQPYLAFWQGRFQLLYLSGLFQEHTPPTRTLLLTSTNSRDWSPPTIVFPEYQLPEIDHDGIHIDAGTPAVMHQRMGFYTAPDGRLLALGFYGYAATPRNSPNAGNGLGRVVAEVFSDGRTGPVYFIRYNRHAGFDESNTTFPFYRTSPDAGLVAACDALLQDRLATLQWWEEDRADDGFYAINPSQVAGAATFSAKITTSAGAGKAFAWYTRPDGVVVGLWKNRSSALSPDRGHTWTPIVQNHSLWTCGAKTWGQRTADGRFAIVHDQSATRKNRFPMVVFTGEDGMTFDTMLCLGGEVPPRRYQGSYKTPGLAYFRGITEVNARPPGDDMWIVYSMNKEDIWISRTTVPINGRETASLREDFEHAASVADLRRWNLYVPQRAPVNVVAESGTSNHVLQLADEDPCDYALAERIFPESRHVRVSFRVQARTVARSNALDVEVQDQRGGRPMRMRVDESWFSFDSGQVASALHPLDPHLWHQVELDFDCAQQSYTVRLDAGAVSAPIPFSERVDSLARVVFRTGPFRGWVAPPYVEHGNDTVNGFDTEDLPGVDERVTRSEYWIDDLQTADAGAAADS